MWLFHFSPCLTLIHRDYRGTSIERNTPLLGPYSSCPLGTYGDPRGVGVVSGGRYPLLERPSLPLDVALCQDRAGELVEGVWPDVAALVALEDSEERRHVQLWFGGQGLGVGGQFSS